MMKGFIQPVHENSKLTLIKAVDRTERIGVPVKCVFQSIARKCLRENFRPILHDDWPIRTRGNRTDNRQLLDNWWLCCLVAY